MEIVGSKGLLVVMVSEKISALLKNRSRRHVGLLLVQTMLPLRRGSFGGSLRRRRSVLCCCCWTACFRLAAGFRMLYKEVALSAAVETAKSPANLVASCLCSFLALL